MCWGSPHPRLAESSLYSTLRINTSRAWLRHPISFLCCLRNLSNACAHRGQDTRVDGHARAKVGHSGCKLRPLLCTRVREFQSAIKLITRGRRMLRGTDHDLLSHSRQQVWTLHIQHRPVSHLHTGRRTREGQCVPCSPTTAACSSRSLTGDGFDIVFLLKCV